MDEALKELGGIGFHQKKIFVIMLVEIAFCSYSIYPVAFFELIPSYTCHPDPGYTTDRLNDYDCTKYDFCASLNSTLTQNTKYIDVFKNLGSLDNWID